MTEQKANDSQDPELEMPRMSLPEHLHELRARIFKSVLAIIVAMFVTFFFYEQIWHFVTEPYRDAVKLQGLDNEKLQAIAPGEGFMGIIKVTFLASAVLVGPFVLWQMWGFISAGLYANERRIVRMFFPVSIGLFALGVVAAYILLIPFGLRFLIGIDAQLGIASSFSVANYISTCVTMVFAMGFVFELPLVMMFVQATGMVERKTLQKGWKVAVVLSLVLGMLLTDPSPITQLMMAIPVVGLYFIGLWAGRFVGDNAETFRIWKAWPLLIGAGVFGSMLVYADTLNDWAAEFFGAGARNPSAVEAPESPSAVEAPEKPPAAEAPEKPPAVEAPEVPGATD